MWHWLERRKIDRYFGGRLGSAPEARMRQHIGACAACRGRYEKQLVAEAALPDGELRSEDRLWKGIAAAAGGPATTVGGSAPRFVVPALVLAAAAAVILVSTPLVRRSTEPVERGSRAPAPAPALHLYRTLPQGGSEPIVDRIRSGDGLLVAYSNPGDAARWLMVFAVDRSCRVYWFYPAYDRPGENPTAIAIRTFESGVELREEIRHDYESPDLRVYGLFLATPMKVLEVEDVVRRGCEARPGAPPACRPLPLDVHHQECRPLEVAP